MDVSADQQHISITLFDVARYFFGCDVKEYIHSTDEKKEDSKYYRKLILSKEKEFNFLVKIQDLKSTKEERSINLIVVEMHEVEKDDAIIEIEYDATIEIEEDDTSTKLITKRIEYNF
ncbi:hypothetical protein HAX54_046212 [Datura stramonium]|uniref:Uncharacterized protein n=1 Tax=Datura stramonium TaxID=4076 RepID=A0ABS8SRC7_DATST|nr:hypothetical protein [Datura stramonium]